MNYDDDDDIPIQRLLDEQDDNLPLSYYRHDHDSESAKQIRRNQYEGYHESPGRMNYSTDMRGDIKYHYTKDDPNGITPRYALVANTPTKWRALSETDRSFIKRGQVTIIDHTSEHERYHDNRKRYAHFGKPGRILKWRDINPPDPIIPFKTVSPIGHESHTPVFKNTENNVEAKSMSDVYNWNRRKHRPR